MNAKNKRLFQPFAFKKGIPVKNRVAMAPMTTWASNEDYTISDEEVNHYRARVRGVGLVLTGCTRVAPSGIGFTHEYAAYDDSFLPSLKKLAAAAKNDGAPAILQIYHAGNKAIPELIPGGDLVSASGRQSSLDNCGSGRMLLIVDEVKAVAAKVGATPAQVALAWLLAQGDNIAPIPGTKRVARVEENTAAGHVRLTADQLQRLNNLTPAAGERHDEMNMASVDH